MAITTSSISVLTSATLLAQISYAVGTIFSSMPVTVYYSGAGTIYLGGPTVTTTTGVPVAAGLTASFVLVAEDILYGVAGSTNTCIVFLQGQ